MARNNKALIPVCVLITTKNEEARIARCLASLGGQFLSCIVVDSNSDDKTADIAQDMGAEVVSYQWNGRYPKKRQWCLENLDLPCDWVLWLDADECLTPEIIDEIRGVFKDDDPTEVGFFICGRYIWNGRILRHGLSNNKIALMHRKRMEFPVVDDLNIAGMGEMEGHYQPILTAGGTIGQVKASLLHDAYDNLAAWQVRHERYAMWEAEITLQNKWSKDPIWWREYIKKTIRKSVFRPYIMFFYSYIIRLGALDGKNGFLFAKSRMDYCFLIRKAFKKR